MQLTTIKGDITKLSVDVIVNAANSSLLGGGGVDGAIHRAGGPAILDDCRKVRARQGGCRTGEAVITTAGKLNANYVVHTVGPVYHDGEIGEAAQLASCYRSCLDLVIEHGQRSVAFPCISTGIYGFPAREAAEVAINTVKWYIDPPEDLEVIFVCFDDKSFAIYQELLAQE